LLPLRFLLRHLLGLNRHGKLLAEHKVRYGHVHKFEPEGARANLELFANLKRDLGSLGEKLLGVVLGHRGLEHLVAHRWEDAVVEVNSELSEDLRQPVLLFAAGATVKSGDPASGRGQGG